jgi:hypothetical protein
MDGGGGAPLAVQAESGEARAGPSKVRAAPRAGGGRAAAGSKRIAPSSHAGHKPDQEIGEAQPTPSVPEVAFFSSPVCPADQIPVSLPMRTL